MSGLPPEAMEVGPYTSGVATAPWKGPRTPTGHYAIIGLPAVRSAISARQLRRKRGGGY